jgi:catechol 2,3-dioxygenase-like lactoylglutathione lyase family enzyme
MLKRIDELLTMYDEKHISRRQLLGALLVASTASPLAAHASQQPPAPPNPDLTGTPPPKDALFRGRMINHVTMMVNDIEESRRFYQELLGASVLVDGRTSPQEGMFDLRIGDSFVTTVKGKSPVIDHFAVGLDPWPGVDRALEMVKKRFPKSAPQPGQNMRSKAAETRSVTLRDPSGIRVQLGSTKYQL